MFKSKSEKKDVVPIMTVLLVGVALEDCSPYIYQPPMTCILELLRGMWEVPRLKNPKD